VRTKSTAHWNWLQLAPQYLYRPGFDNRVEDESAPGVSLAIGAMTAVHSHRLVQKLITHIPAGATAGELSLCPWFLLFHVLIVLLLATISCKVANPAFRSMLLN
jgi:hypothetical protein